MLDRFRLDGKVAVVTGADVALGDAEEAASPLVFLASPASSYVTGTVLLADGGILTSLPSM